MLTTYRWRSSGHESRDGTMPEDAIWIDLSSPTADEARAVERRYDVEIPSKASLSEIEASSRLIAKGGKLYLSSPAVRIDEHGETHLTPVGFITGADALVTVRFAELPFFGSVAERVAAEEDLRDGMGVFTALLGAMVDRGADVLEHLGSTTDALSRDVFAGSLLRSRRPIRSSRRLREALESVGTLADRLAQARDVMLGVQRIAAFAGEVGGEWVDAETKKQLLSISRDVTSLTDYESRLSDKIQLLLDAVLGFVNIAQNDLFKILTIVSVVGVPPTILVGIWGMNFKSMPELAWAWGYPLAWLAISASVALPLAWFRWAGWFD